jgi:hypothetical protein
MARDQYARHVELLVQRGTTTKPPVVLPGAQINPRHDLFPIFHAAALALGGGGAEESASLVQCGLGREPGFRIRVFSEFTMARPIAEKFSEGAPLLGLPE